ncbi:MAG: branched-chain amino acid ABC transporter permease, partial [Proteobacteria bacterium]|nr:branched-chain amino acid ABC transporter permease [Pseudomonadota bacterium]
MATKKITTIALLVTVVVIVQIGTQLTGTSYYLTQLTMTMYSCLLIIGLCLVMGYAGQISLGHAGFFAIGGYTSASLTTLNVLPSLESGSSCVHLLNSFGLLTASTSMYGDPLLRIHPWIAFVVAITLTALIAFALGIPVLKLKGHYLAMATLGFGIIIFRIV